MLLRFDKQLPLLARYLYGIRIRLDSIGGKVTAVGAAFTLFDLRVYLFAAVGVNVNWKGSGIGVYVRCQHD